MENLLLTLRMPPSEFANWVAEKKLGGRDLAPLRAVKDEAFLQSLLGYIGRTSPNKNFGTQALEWAVDLHLMGKEVHIPVEYSRETFMNWHSELKDQRFARRAAQRKALEEKIQQAPWPRNVRAQVVEKGDQVGFEVKIFAESAEDLGRKVDLLRQCAEKMVLKDKNAE